MNNIKYNFKSLGIGIFIFTIFFLPHRVRAFWPLDNINIMPDSPFYFLDTFFEDLEMTLFPSRSVNLALQKVKERKEEFEYLKYKNYDKAEEFKESIFKKDIERLEKELRKLPPEAIPRDKIKEIVDDKTLEELDFLKGDEFKFVKHGLMDFSNKVFSAEDFGVFDETDNRLQGYNSDALDLLGDDLDKMFDDTGNQAERKSEQSKYKKESRVKENKQKERADMEDEVESLGSDLDSLLGDLENF